MSGYTSNNKQTHRSNSKNDDPYGRGMVEDYARKPRGDIGHAERQQVGYELEHLATFAMSNTGQDVVIEAMEKLEKMSSKAGIWTMQCVMVIESRNIVIIDKRSDELLENFPLYNIINPIPIMNWKNNGRFSNIVLFIAYSDKAMGRDEETHIFQAVNASAERIVDEILNAKDSLGAPRSNIGMPPAMSPEPSPLFSMPPSFDHQAAQRSAFATENYDYDRHLSMRDKLPNENDQSSEQQERYIQLLNHCFDDIEKFAMKMKDAADAFHQLEERSKAKKKKKGGNGNGMLTMRAKPPPPQAFIDIFVKFKLTFNLLAILKPHIHDPNAPELVHFVFAPLSLIVDAVREEEGEPRLARSVVSPLISPDAKDLLTNCLSSKEIELWQSLGPSWFKSSDEWGGETTPCKIKFFNGWEPSPAFLEGVVVGDYRKAVPPSLNGKFDRDYGRPEPSNYRGDDYYRQPETTPYRRPREASPPRRFEETSPYSQGYRNEIHRQPDQIRTEPPEISHHHYDDYSRAPARNPSPALPKSPVMSNNYSEYARSISPQPMRNDIPSASPADSSRSYISDLLAKGSRVCKVLHSRAGKNKQELTVTKDEILEILDDEKNWWQVKNRDGTVGYCPYTILKCISGDGM